MASRWMYYFGGGLDGLPNEGLRMRIGLATSEDGLSWRKAEAPILEPTEGFDELFVAWPRVLPPWKTKEVPGLEKRW